MLVTLLASFPIADDKSNLIEKVFILAHSLKPVLHEAGSHNICVPNSISSLPNSCPQLLYVF